MKKPAAPKPFKPTKKPAKKSAKRRREPYEPPDSDTDVDLARGRAWDNAA